MKPNAAKKLTFIFRLFLLIFCVMLCLYGYRLASGKYHATAPAGFVNGTSSPYLDADRLVSLLEEKNIPCLTASSEDVLADAAGLLDQGVDFLTVSLDQTNLGHAPQLIALARQAGATLLFTGHAPDHTLLETYDKAWYLGSNPAYGGELMGQTLAMAYREGTIKDHQPDNLLQYLFYAQGADQAEPLIRYTLKECEHYGVFSAEYAAPAEDSGSREDPYTGLDEFEKQLMEQQQTEETAAPPPELLLWVGSANRESALADIRNNGWDNAPYTAAFAYSVQEAEQFAQQGCSLVVYYDYETVTALASQLALNRENGAPMPEDIGISPDGRYFIVPYQIFE